MSALRGPFSDGPPPNRACDFHRTRLSSATFGESCGVERRLWMLSWQSRPPPHPAPSTDDVSIPSTPMDSGQRERCGMVPVFTVNQLTSLAPSFAPAASPNGYAADLHRGLPAGTLSRLRSRPSALDGRALRLPDRTALSSYQVLRQPGGKDSHLPWFIGASRRKPLLGQFRQRPASPQARGPLCGVLRDGCWRAPRRSPRWCRPGRPGPAPRPPASGPDQPAERTAPSRTRAGARPGRPRPPSGRARRGR